MKIFGSKETEEEDVLLTPWSAIHLLSGMAAKDLGIGIWTFEGLHMLYEIKDYNTETNSLINSFGDQITATLGHFAASRTQGYLWVWLYVGSWATATQLGQYG